MSYTFNGFLVAVYKGIYKWREKKRLTVCWLNCDSRPVVQNPVNHVEIVLYLGPQLTLLNLFSKIHHEQENTKSKAKQKHNTVEKVMTHDTMKLDIVHII